MSGVRGGLVDSSIVVARDAKRCVTFTFFSCYFMLCRGIVPVTMISSGCTVCTCLCGGESVSGLSDLDKYLTGVHRGVCIGA